MGLRELLQGELCLYELLHVPPNHLYIYIYSKVHPRTDHEVPKGEQMHSSTLPSTSELDGVGGQRHAPAALLPGKTRYPLYRRLGGPQGRSGWVRKISPPQGFDPGTVQPAASRLYRLSYPGPYISLI